MTFLITADEKNKIFQRKIDSTNSREKSREKILLRSINWIFAIFVFRLIVN
jgi:hypothetical protein